MYYVRYILMVLILFKIQVNCLPQQVRFDHFDISNQLSQNNIFNLIVDDIGYIWIGTLEGLNRFDGYEFKAYKPTSDRKNNISGSAFIELANSKNGNIWAITRNGGLYYYNSELDALHAIPDSLLSGYSVENTTMMVESATGDLWMTDYSTLGIFNPKANSFHVTETDSINSMISSPDEGMLISNEKGVFRVIKTEPQENALQLKTSQVYAGTVYQLYCRDDNTIFGLNENQLLVWKDLNEEPEIALDLTEFNLPDFTVQEINSFVANKNELWMGGPFSLIRINFDSTKQASIYKYDRNNPFSFKGRTVRNLVFDKNENLWIGTVKHGLNLVDNQKNQFLHYQWKKNSEQSLNIDPVRCIHKSKNGNLWFGFDRYGVGVQYPNGDQELYQDFFERDGTVSNITRVRSIFEDSKGNIWIGDSKELGRYNPSRNRIESASYKYNWSWQSLCYVIKEFEPGRLIISGDSMIGIVDLNTNKLSILPESDNDVSLQGFARDIIQDEHGNFWVALNLYGIVKIDHATNTYSKIDITNSELTNNKLYALRKKGDQIWIGTNNGLNVYSISENRIVHRYFESDGLSNNIVYSVYDDSEGNIWTSTNNGISCFNIEKQSFSNYLENDFFMDDAHFKDHEGNLYYGGYTGIVSFKPEKIQPAKSIRHPVLENFYLANKIVHPNDTVNNKILLEKSISKTNKLRLSYFQNSFSISFNAFPFNYPNSNQFKYRLDGLQSDWIYSIESNRLATYTGLQPGNYQFHLTASSGDGTWSDPVVLDIEIIPPFWKTRWFLLSIILLLVFITIILYRRRVQEIKRRNILLKEKVEEQTSELKEQNRQIMNQKLEMELMAKDLHEADQAKLRFFTNISHEFKTPLTLIMGHLDNLNHTGSNKTIKSIRNNAIRLLRLVNQLLDIRKLDQDKMHLSVHELDIVQLTREITESFQIVAKKKNIDLRFFSSSEKLKVWLDGDKMEKILHNLISNSIKYTPGDKGIVVSIFNRQEKIELHVTDQGRGIPDEDLDFIFNRFYQGSGKSIEGHGIGLSYVKSLVEIQQGLIEVKSKKNTGTEFILSFKKGNQHFSANDLTQAEGEKIGFGYEELIIHEWEPFNPGAEILVLEDNDDLRDFLKELLSKHFKVTTAINGKEAFILLKNLTPEIIISDIIMSEMDGITFCGKLKKNTSTSHIPIILLTAKSDVETKIEGFELGIDDYIEKPFDPKLLLTRINSILENRQKMKDLILAHNSRIEDIKDKISSTDKIFWSQITEIIGQNYSIPDFSVDEMSIKMNMSRSSFFRKFKGLTGISPGDYLRKFRLQKAKSLIMGNDLKNKQIINEVGFQSVSHFRKSFKEEFGKTPAEMRNNP